jgi:N-acetylmuramoyl-L-alanine amidase
LDYASSPEALASLKDSAQRDARAAGIARGIVNFVRGTPQEASNAAKP